MPNGHALAGVTIAVVAAASACADGSVTYPSREAPESAATSPKSSHEQSPGAPSVEDGVPLAVPSHCGVLSVTVDGRLWLAAPPLGDHNPPPGWDENETPGVFVRTDSDEAVFRGDHGQRALFRLAAWGAEDPNAGCE